jgi:hypothetical protein
MRRILAAVAVVAAISFTAAAAQAAVIWQESFAPDPSGQTSVNIQVSFPLAAPSTDARLTVNGGTFAQVAWSSLSTYSIYFWWELPQGSGNWVLYQDNTYDLGAETITTGPSSSSYHFDANGFYDCYGSGYHAPGMCGAVFAFGYAGVDGALVDASRPFTLTLSTGVPEPSSWAMMLGGFAMLGLALRGRRAGVHLAGS